jgi:hypothetical protein
MSAMMLEHAIGELAGCPSAAVLKMELFFVGTTVLRGMSLVKTPPVVSMPRVNGHTSLETVLSLIERPWRNEHKDDIAKGLFAGHDTSLDRSTVGDSLVRVDALGELLAAAGDR